jgi:hypothetical protein
MCADSPRDTSLTAETQALNWGPPEITHADFSSATARKECELQGQDVNYIDPIPKLVELAKNQNLVMINEAHFKPVHRAFIGEFAIALKDIGFNFYGAEALNPAQFSIGNRNQALSERGYPIKKDGSSYIAEPIFGQLIETVMAHDYTVFAYEVAVPPPPGADSADSHREQHQANNILGEINGDKTKKVLIHAGYHHIKEEESATGRSWMAKRLKDSSGIDPLTISQTDCYSQSAFEQGVLGYAMPVDGSGNPITSDGYDVVIIPPKEIQFRDRPLWLKTVSGRRFINVPDTIKFDDQFTRITAYNLDRVEDAVIEDNIYRPPNSDKPLALRPGRYRLEVTDKDKAVLAQETIFIERSSNGGNAASP